MPFKATGLAADGCCRAKINHIHRIPVGSSDDDLADDLIAR